MLSWTTVTNTLIVMLLLLLFFVMLGLTVYRYSINVPRKSLKAVMMRVWDISEVISNCKQPINAISQISDIFNTTVGLIQWHQLKRKVWSSIYWGPGPTRASPNPLIVSLRSRSRSWSLLYPHVLGSFWLHHVLVSWLSLNDILRASHWGSSTVAPRAAAAQAAW